jgi:hypothetical protein
VKIITAFSAFLVIGATIGACGDTNAVTEPPGGSSSSSSGSGDAGPINFDAGVDPETGAPKDCFDNPKTHFEIINRCTRAARVIREQTKSTKLFADGGLAKP